jgi:Fe-S cluster assembly protein SufD
MDQREQYISNFAELEARVAKHRPPSLHRVCRAALDRFAQLGFPTTRLEDWRFTNVTPIAQTSFVPAPNGLSSASTPRESLGRDALKEAERSRLVFVNGRYASALSEVSRLPDGLMIGSLATALEQTPALVEPHLARHARYDDNAFVALNTAFVEDGAFVCIPDGVIVDDPIRLLFVSTVNGRASISHPRNLIVAGSNSRAVITESYLGGENGAYFTNAVTEMVVGTNAVVEHLKVQLEREEAFHVASLTVRQGRDSKVSLHSISLGGSLVRNDVSTRLAGEGADCVLNGLYMVGGRQHVDNHTMIDHATPLSSSLENYRGVVDGRAHAVFSGRIDVQPGAQKIVARQSNRNLLLSEDAVVNTQPHLRIYADDVKCFHGATVGMLDEDALFYLRSRGMTAEMARDLLVYGFVREVLGAIGARRLRNDMEQLVLERLPTGSELLDVA